MGNYSSRAFRNYGLNKEIYDFLLPVYGLCAEDNGFKRGSSDPFIVERSGMYFFCGTRWDYKEMLERCEYQLIDLGLLEEYKRHLKA